MKKTLHNLFPALILLFFFGQMSAQHTSIHGLITILYFNPEVEPDLEEIKEPTNTAFFTAVSDKISNRKNRVLRTGSQIVYDSIDSRTIAEYAMNNNADFIVVPKIKYFKVGIGKYVFSNQVLVRMKVYDTDGNLITSAEHDTYRKNRRLLGSTVNSIKIGTLGAMKSLMAELQKLKTHSGKTF